MSSERTHNYYFSYAGSTYRVDCDKHGNFPSPKDEAEEKRQGLATSPKAEFNRITSYGSAKKDVIYHRNNSYSAQKKLNNLNK